MNNKKLKRVILFKNIFSILFFLSVLITLIDFIVPDPILFIDEALLASITGLFTIILSTLDDKERELRKGNNTNIKQEDISKIAVAVGDVTKNIKKLKK